MERTPLEDILDFSESEPGRCLLEVPASACFGLVVTGGLSISICHKAAQHAVTSSSRSSTHPHLLHSSVHFLRPIFASPKVIEIRIQPANTSRLWTIVHAEIFQDEKRCLFGYLTFTDLTLPGHVSAPTGWRLSPPPLPASLDKLQADKDPCWVSYLTPLKPGSVRNGQAYIRYHLPVQRQDPNFVDFWVTPGWADSRRSQGAVWTNESIHFVIDVGFPDWHNHISPDEMPNFRYDDVVNAGLEQRLARQGGRDDRIFGEKCGPVSAQAWMDATVTASTEIKKALPSEGIKWLFLRCFSHQIENDRFDRHTYVLDRHGELIAISHQHMHVIPLAAKMQNKSTKL